ncbi:MAG: hypothetical protein ACOCU6_02965 [Nanoarchaeota archaeon]
MRKRYRKRSWLEQYGGVLALGLAIILIIVLVITLLSNGGDEDGNNESYEINGSEIETLTSGDENDSKTQTIEKGLNVKKNSRFSEEGLCEDYFFEQGDQLEIADHIILVERIAKSSLRLEVDDERTVFGLGDEKRLGDGIRIKLDDDNIAYFGVDDPSNAVTLRIGCDHDEDPIDKLVEKRGSEVCKALYDQCRDSFDFETD